MRTRYVLSAVAVAILVAVLASWPRPAPAYIGGPPLTLGLMCSWSTHVVSVRVERVDREKNVIVFRKLVDFKGKWPAEVIRQVVPPNLADRERIFEWAEPGKTTGMYALEAYRWSHTYIDSVWYASNTADWQLWQVSHGEPLLLRMYSGKSERLVPVSQAILAGKEVIVPCLSDGPAEELRLKKTKVQRLRASIKRLDYNAQRDFVAWGSDDFTGIQGLPGFTHLCTVGRVDPEAQVISCADFTADGKLDLCLAGGGKVLLLQNSGDYWAELPLPEPTDCRAAVWADYNHDGLPDLLLATSGGPRLFANQGQGIFRDVTNLLPKTAGNIAACAWLDQDGDGWPDILLATGFQGLRLYRNRGTLLPPGRPKPGQPLPLPQDQGFEDVSVAVGLGPDGLAGSLRGDTLHACDVNGDGRTDFLFAGGGGTLALNTPTGFVLATDCGIAYRYGKVSPAFGDYDGDGHADLFVPQLDGHCKLFHNDGLGHFRDVTAQAGDLARALGMATSAAWGDFDNDGLLDLVVGCLRGPNRFFRNRGGGCFEDASEAIGLTQRIFNSQAVALVDLNADGMLDLILANEGQESAVLLGNPERGAGRTPVALHLGGPLGVVGCTVRLLDQAGKPVASQFIGGGDGRGQPAPLARFALEPGQYHAQVRFSSGLAVSRPFAVGGKPLHTVLDDEMPREE